MKWQGFKKLTLFVIFRSVQLLSHVRLFATQWTAAHRASLSITNSWSLLKLMSIELVMPSNHLSLCRPLLLCLQSFPSSRSFHTSQFFASGGQSIGVSASASVLPMNIQDWFAILQALITFPFDFNFVFIFAAKDFSFFKKNPLVLKPLSLSLKQWIVLYFRDTLV